MDKNPLISVIVCGHFSKRFDNMVKCIESLLNNEYQELQIIIVIDGNEELKQNIESKFKDNKILIIGNTINEGPSIGRNRGIKYAKGDIIAFVDDDAYVPTDWLVCIAKTFCDYSEIISVGGKLLPVYEDNYRLPEEILWIVGCTYKGHPEKRQFVRNVISANMAVKKDIFNEIDFQTLYDKKNGIYFPNKELEDTLFCVRLNDKKCNAVLYDPDIIAYHNVSKDRLKLSYILKRTFSEGMLKAKLKNLESRNSVLTCEQNYLNTLLLSIMKKFFTLNIRDSMLLSITVLSVASGYIFEHIINIRNNINNKR